MTTVLSFGRFTRRTSLLAVGLLALFVLPRSLHAQQTIHVPADQPTIQAAINAANNGDTVLVAPGTYVENINFNGKAITVTSAGGPSVTIIDGGAKGSVVTFITGETSSSVLSSFTIRNGHSDFNTPGFGAGGGIFIHSSSPIISGNLITGNHSVHGIGIYIDGGTPAIQGNTITGNTECCGSGPGGGGIEITAGTVIPSVPQIIGNVITNNTLLSGGDGGGIYLNGGNGAIIRNNLIQSNTVYNGGGGVSLIGGGSASLIQNVIVNNSTIGNSGGSGGGLSIVGPSSTSFTIFGNTIAGNTAFDNTSGVYISTAVLSSPLTFTNNIVVAANSQTAITCDPIRGSLSPSFSYNEVYSAGPTQAGNCDFTSLPGNISSDPLFMSAANGDFHLKLGSPAINAGDTTAPNLPTTDFDGNPRTRSVNGATTIDLGTYEVVNTSTATINPNSLSFGTQAVGTTSTPQPTVLSSTGTTPFQISSVQTTSGYAQTNTCPVLGTPGSAPGVPNGASCSFSIAFTPPSNGLFGGLLTVNGTNGTSLQVALSGTGFTPAPAVSLTPASLSFSPQFVGTTSASQPVTLANTGTASLNISSIAASQPFLQTNNCPAILAAAANCTINVSFQPTVSGNAAGTLTIVDNASGSPHTVGLSGTGNPVPQPVAITLIQHAGRDAGATTSTSLAFPSNNTAGNWIAVAIRAGHSGQSFTVKDSKGNAYHQAVQFNVTVDAPNGDTQGLFYAENIAGGTNQVTVSDTISGSILRIAILEYSGVASSGSLDATTAAQGMSNAPLSGSITTSANGDLLLGAVLTGSPENFTAGPGYLIEQSVPAEPGTKLIVEDQLQSVSGTVSATASLGAAANWGAAIAAFKAATTSVSTAPTITSLNPPSGVPGNSVTITGTNFGSTQGTSTVTFNGGAPVTAASWSATSIVVTVPAGTTTGNVTVTVGGVASNGVVFTILAPRITSVSPSSGAAGTVITISGTNFGPSQGASTVTFNVTPAIPTSWNATSIVVPVPAGATTGNLVVMAGGLASSVPFTINPTITSVNPSFGPVGTVVTISGTNFGGFVPGDTVTFNGTTIQNAASWIDTGISVPVPNVATTGPVVVTAGGFASNSSVNFTVTPVTITSLNPASGPTGTLVTITGTNFGPTQGASFVSIGGFTATPTSWSQTSIVVPVPTGATTGSVGVAVGGVVSSNALTFTVTSPSISGVSNNNTNVGPVGTPVTITGANFGASQGGSTVTFNGVAATPTSWSNTSIVGPVPNGAKTGLVVVTVGGIPSNGANFIVTANITGVSPNSGPLGTKVTVSGTNFGAAQGSSQLTFGGVGDTPSSWSDTSLGGITPPNLGAGTWGISVTVGGYGSNSVGFQLTPAITSLSPTSGPVGTPVTINGSSFGVQSRGTVTFNGIAGTPTSWSDTSIVVPVPNGATTGNVVVTANGVPSNGFTFTVSVTPGPPNITGLSPNAGLIGASITISGVFFGAAQGASTVTFNGVSAGTASSWGATIVTVNVPGGATTGNVVVTVGGQASNGVPFTVVPPPNITNLSPSSGPVGTSVTITGTSFGATQGAGNVTFNGSIASVTSWSGTNITAIAPAAGTGNVVVTVNGTNSNGVLFTLIPPPPTISSLNPTFGPVGSSVIVTGANFGGPGGTSTVTFNGIVASPTSWIGTIIVAPVPSGATSGNVVVTVGGVASNGVPFTVTSAAPSIALVQHTSKDAGTTSSSTVAFSANNAAGNFIAVVIRAGKSGQAFSVSDSRGNIYKQAIQFSMTVDAETVGIFYAENIAGGANTITVSDTILGTMRFAIFEYSGVATSNSLDVTIAAQGTSASPGTGNVTTASSGDLLLGAIVTADSETFNAGTGCIIEERVPAPPNSKLLVEDQRQTIAGPASAGASLGASDPWGAVLAAFRHP
jgi:hypothetical protein